MKILLVAGLGNIGTSVANKAIIERLAQEFPDMAIRKIAGRLVARIREIGAAQ